MRRVLLLVASGLFAAGCYNFENDLRACREAGGCQDPASTDDGGVGVDGGGVPDAGEEADSGVPDAGGGDAGQTDAGQTDAGAADAGPLSVNRLKRCTPDFCPENPAPGSDRINGIWGKSANDVWFVGSDGLALHFDGQTFDSHPIPDFVDLRDVWVSPLGTVWIAGDNGGLYRGGLDGGFVDFTSVFGAVDMNAVWGRAENEFFVGGKSGEARRYLNGTFTQLAGIPATEDITSLQGTSAELWAVTNAGKIYELTGVIFNPTSTITYSPLRDVWSSPDAGEVWVVGQDKTLLRRQPTGTWLSVDAGVTGNGAFFSVWRTPQGKMYLADLTGLLHEASNFSAPQFDNRGARPIVPESADLLSVWVADDDTVFAGGAYGSIIRGGADGGFRRLPTPNPRHQFTSVWARSATDAWAVGYSGLIKRRVGTRWVYEQLPVALQTTHLFAVTGDADKVYAVGEGGRAFERTDAGWMLMQSAGGNDLRAATLHQGYLYAVGQGGTIVRYPTDGGSIETEVSSTNYTLNAIASRGANLYAVGDTSTVLFRDTGGWAHDPTGEGVLATAGTVTVSGVTICPNGKVWATASNKPTLFDLSAPAGYTAPLGMQGLTCDGTNSLWAVGINGLFYNRTATGAGSQPFTATERSLFSVTTIPGLANTLLVAGQGETILRWR